MFTTSSVSSICEIHGYTQNDANTTTYLENENETMLNKSDLNGKECVIENKHDENFGGYFVKIKSSAVSTCIPAENLKLISNASNTFNTDTEDSTSVKTKNIGRTDDFVRYHFCGFIPKKLWYCILITFILLWFTGWFIGIWIGSQLISKNTESAEKSSNEQCYITSIASNTCNFGCHCNTKDQEYNGTVYR